MHFLHKGSIEEIHNLAYDPQRGMASVVAARHNFETEHLKHCKC